MFVSVTSYDDCLCILIQLLVSGGNGFVGSHVCKEALACGLSVASLSRYNLPQ